MRKIIYMLAVLLSASVVLSSCLKSDDDNDVTLYDDMAITSFTLGTLNRYTSTTSSSTGNDTTIKTTVTGSNYAMNIDHLRRTISNQTPLLWGTDLKHVTCTLTTRNSGVVYVKNVDSDTLVYHSSADSIDFTQPRTFRVFAIDGSGARDYTVTLTVEEQQSTTYAWKLQAVTADTTDFENRQLCAQGDTVVLAQREAEPDWDSAQKDDADSLLPAPGTTAVVSWDYAPVANARYLLAVGQPRQDNEAYMRLWRQIAVEGQQGQWVFMPWDETNPYRLPRQEWYALAYHSDLLLAIGPDHVVRQSRDQGITWKTRTDYVLPDELEGERLHATTDDEGCLWLVTSSGQVWKWDNK